MNVKKNASLLFFCVMVLSLVASSAQATIIKKEYSGSSIRGYAKYTVALLFTGMNTWEMTQKISILSKTRNSAKLAIDFAELIVVSALNYWVLKLAFQSANDEFEAVAQEERDKLADAFASAQQARP